MHHKMKLLECLSMELDSLGAEATRSGMSDNPKDCYHEAKMIKTIAKAHNELAESIMWEKIIKDGYFDGEGESSHPDMTRHSMMDHASRAYKDAKLGKMAREFAESNPEAVEEAMSTYVTGAKVKRQHNGESR